MTKDIVTIIHTFKVSTSELLCLNADLLLGVKLSFKNGKGKKQTWPPDGMLKEVLLTLFVHAVFLPLLLEQHEGQLLQV